MCAFVLSSNLILFDGSKKSEKGMTRDHPVTKPPVNAIPFSDEWLAAMEAAGEVIHLLLN